VPFCDHNVAQRPCFCQQRFDQAYWPRSSIVSWTHHLLRAAHEVGVVRVVVTGSCSAVGHRLDDPSAPSDEALQVYPFEPLMPIGGKA
jgi:nucleoside-diphosphate-sugar epimerase